ncbi:MAG: hypothetical protein AVDCRST_MAG73-365, partial [uncultured Thermomicrobiales bacterium]
AERHSRAGPPRTRFPGIHRPGYDRSGPSSRRRHDRPPQRPSALPHPVARAILL